MNSFNEWLLKRDPELYEGINLRKVGSWAAKKGVPLAFNIATTIMGPQSQATHDNPVRQYHQASRQAFGDDYFATKQSRKGRREVKQNKRDRRLVQYREPGVSSGEE